MTINHTATHLTPVLDAARELGRAARFDTALALLDSVDSADGDERLRDEAPDADRRGWALMCLGWFADNLRGDRQSSPAPYAEALEIGRDVDDAMLVFEAQRHLGDHLHDDGDLDGALTAWQESTAAAARAGHLTGVLAQQLLLAVLARDAGDEGGAVLLTTELRRWAEAVGAEQIVGRAEGFLAGADPTRAPESAEE